MTLNTVPVFRTMYNNMPLPGFTNTMPSMTTPDMSMSLVELIKRFGSGSVPLNVGNDPYYDGLGHDTEITDDVLLGRHWDTYDLDEKHEILKTLKGDYSRITKGIAEGQKAKADKLAADRKADLDERNAIKKYLEARAAERTNTP